MPQRLSCQRQSGTKVPVAFSTAPAPALSVRFRACATLEGTRRADLEKNRREVLQSIPPRPVASRVLDQHEKNHPMGYGWRDVCKFRIDLPTVGAKQGTANNAIEFREFNAGRFEAGARFHERTRLLDRCDEPPAK